MEITERVICYFLKPSGDAPFVQWYEKLRDRKGRQIILARLTRLQKGIFGDCKPVGEGVVELHETNR